MDAAGAGKLFFFFFTIQKKGENLPAEGDGRVTTEATKGLRWKLLTDLNPFSVVVFSLMYCFYLPLPACIGWKT